MLGKSVPGLQKHVYSENLHQIGIFRFSREFLSMIEMRFLCHGKKRKHYS